MSDIRRLTLVCLGGAVISVPTAYLVVTTMLSSLSEKQQSVANVWVVEEFRPGSISETTDELTGQIEGQLIDFVVCRKGNLTFELEVVNMHFPHGLKVGSQFKLTSEAENRVRRKITDSGQDRVVMHFQGEDVFIQK